MVPGQHHVIRDAGRSIGGFLQTYLRENGYKRLEIISAAPKSDAVEGKLPALGLYLHNVMLDEDSLGSNRTAQYIETVTGSDGNAREIARDMPLWVRLDYLVSAWAQTPDEEQLLIGCAIKGMLENPVLRGEALKGESFKSEEYLPITLSQKLDEGVLSRFWASLNQPMKPAIQCWTTVPIYPGGGVEVRRVQEKDVRFFDLDKINRGKR